MSQDFDTFDPPPLPNSPLRKLGSLAIILATISIVAIPMMLLEGPREVGRWHEAAAVEMYLDGKPQQAFLQLDKALQWNPDSFITYLARAQWKREQGELQQALDNCRRALEIRQNNIAALLEMSTINQLMRRHHEAVKQWEVILGMDQGQRNYTQPVPPVVKQKQGRINQALALNGLAYARAVGNIYLDKGLDEIEIAIRLEKGEIRMFDMAGCYHYHSGNFSAALRNLTLAVDLAEPEFRRPTDRLKKHPGSIEKASDSDITPAEKRDRRKMKREYYRLQLRTTQARDRLARLLVHRGMVFQKMDQGEKAKKDFTQAGQLKANVESLQESFPSFKEAALAASSASAILDTRGFLYFRRGDYTSARRDLETACNLSESLLLIFQQGGTQKQKIIDPREAQLEQRRSNKSAAVIYYHRALLYRSLKMTKQAEADFRRVQELGFEAGEHLF